jgi:PIN domain nuclease of toxin-antitoxin system
LRLLLDTHAMYWYAAGDPQLSPHAQAPIQDATNEVLISPASYWEIAIKVSIGKWIMHRPYEDFMDTCLKVYGFRVLPIEPKHTAKVATLPFPPGHKDPFDRLLVAQALVEAIAIVSSDAALNAYGVKRLW